MKKIKRVLLFTLLKTIEIGVSVCIIYAVGKTNLAYYLLSGHPPTGVVSTFLYGFGAVFILVLNAVFVIVVLASLYGLLSILFEANWELVDKILNRWD